jgi:hypothetical protein
MSEKDKDENIENNNNVDEIVPTEDFYKIVNDFTIDIITTFPEYSAIINKWWNNTNHLEETEGNTKHSDTLYVFRHCIKVFPERFFDILYKNVDIFSEDTNINTEFLPGIVFKHLWTCEISDQTRETIWKYLQLILFSVIGSVHTTSQFGSTAKMFDEIDADTLKNKLHETLAGMQCFFDNNKSDTSDTNNDSSTNKSNPFSGINKENIPNADDIHEHIQSMMSGKLGALAMSLAEETAGDLNLDMENITDAKDAFQQLFQNPGKMMNMVKNIGSRIDEKIKSGEIKETELMEEGMQLLNKMKDMPGMGDMQKMFSQMGMPMPGLGKGAKLNLGAMENNLNQKMKNAKLKERLRAKADAFAKAASG